MLLTDIYRCQLFVEIATAFSDWILYSMELGNELNKLHSSGEQGMVDEAQKALEEAEALKKVSSYFSVLSFWPYRLVWML